MGLADVAVAVRTAAATCMLLVSEHWQWHSEAAAALALGVHGDGKRIVSRTLPLLRPRGGGGGKGFVMPVHVCVGWRGLC